MNDEPKITENEMWELFGDVIPITTASKLFDKEKESTRTNKEVREMLVADANEWWNSGKAHSAVFERRMRNTFINAIDGAIFAGEIKGLLDIHDAFERNEVQPLLGEVTVAVIISNQILLKLTERKILTWEDIQRNDNRKFTYTHIREGIKSFTQSLLM